MVVTLLRTLGTFDCEPLDVTMSESELKIKDNAV